MGDGTEQGVRGVLFDAGNTLIRVRDSVGSVYAAAARRRGVSVDAELLERSFRREFAARRAGFVSAVAGPHTPERERRWWRSLVAEVFRAGGVWTEVAPLYEELFGEIYADFASPEPWEVFPDVIPCLDALAARGVPTAVVSNWDSRLHGVLAGLGLLERFRFVLVSAEFGVEKPDPAIFREAVRRLGLEPSAVLHVGDLEHDDVRGARDAGLHALLLDRDRAASGNGPRIDSLERLPERLSG